MDKLGVNEVTKFKLGRMGHTKKGFGSKHFFGMAKGSAQVVRQKI